MKKETSKTPLSLSIKSGFKQVGVFLESMEDAVALFDDRYPQYEDILGVRLSQYQKVFALYCALYAKHAKPLYFFPVRRRGSCDFTMIAALIYMMDTRKTLENDPREEDKS